MQKWVIPCNVKNFDIVKHLALRAYMWVKEPI